jgi:polar amino acid transport system permease protein
MPTKASSFDLLGEWGGNLIVGALSTIQISLWAYALGLCLGLLGAVGKLNGGPILRGVLDGYTTLVRSVPELVLIVILYYAGTDTLNRLLDHFGFEAIHISGFVAAVCVLGFVQGAYSTEVLRGAIQAIPIGQIEAARAFGMSPGLRFRRVTLPAMLPYAIPGMANLWLNATKDSALVAVVGYGELALATRQAAGGTKAYFLFYVVAAAIYLTISIASLYFFSRVESHYRRGQHRAR